jgi:Resolvase, N terminal domain
MAIYAYLRISTDKQDVDNQRHGLLEYANSHKLMPLEFREDTVSSKIRWRERGIGKILEGARAGMSSWPQKSQGLPAPRFEQSSSQRMEKLQETRFTLSLLFLTLTPNAAPEQSSRGRLVKHRSARLERTLGSVADLLRCCFVCKLHQLSPHGGGQVISNQFILRD